jgi:hypothetical protein
MSRMYGKEGELSVVSPYFKALEAEKDRFSAIKELDALFKQHGIGRIGEKKEDETQLSAFDIVDSYRTHLNSISQDKPISHKQAFVGLLVMYEIPLQQGIEAGILWQTCYGDLSKPRQETPGAQFLRELEEQKT